MKEIEYQKKYVRRLVDTATEILTDEDRDTGTIVFKAPTGSGKTYMVSQAMTHIVKENPNVAFAFIWISVNKLHEQSLNSLSRYFEDERLLECLTNSELNNNTIEQNEIMFVNWESINKENSLFRVDNELNWNLQTVVENTKDEDKTIVLLIDESHRNAKTDKSQELIDIISPRLVIEITATPKPSTGTLIDIPLQAVIREGMIKKEIQINAAKQEQVKSNKDLLLFALRKRKQLQTAYQSLGTNINPLLLIQIPNKKANDIIQPEDEIIEILSNQGISVQSGKLALWLSEDKRNKEDVESNISPVEVLIFKEAIALGWDCPRASILFLQREWNNERFEFNIQTLGRIMRMPEQMHYEDKPELNVGYVYSASNAFTIVEELAKDYVSEQKLIIDNEIYNKRPQLFNEHIRRKRELTRLSGDFKTVFNEAAKANNLKEKINTNVTQISKQIKLSGKIEELDKEQDVAFDNSRTIEKSKAEIQNSYDTFIRQIVAPYEVARSQNILKTTIRSWFKNEFGIGDEDIIQLIVMSQSKGNYGNFKTTIEEAKDLYKNLPTKTDETITNPNWEVPTFVNIFSNFEEVKPSTKSILKQEDTNCFLAKTNKNGNSELSKPEKDFIARMEASDDYLQWWFKNGKGEAKYFSIAYKKEDGFLYGFYPDFILKTKKETIIVEIKDDKDFKADNYYKLLAGRDYLTRLDTNSEEKTRFYILSPVDYFDFFKHLNDMNLDSFEAIYERRLTKFIKSQQLQISAKIESKEKLSKSEEEYKELFAEYENSLSKLEDEAFKRELAELELEEARKINEQYKSNIEILFKHSDSIKKTEDDAVEISVPTPFNICILGEVSDEALIRNQLNRHFQKLGVDTIDWSVDFYDNAKLQNSKILRSLQKGQSKYSLIVTGQIFHHSGKGNEKANIIAELKNGKYIPHIIGCSPKELLTPDTLTEVIHKYLTQIGN
ncbi:DEAD/DEAH box helicase [Proteiniphilum propionicum]|jgi:type III restriction enzyme|uniref:DEAD/DEAH box helicase n=1 Tax=Proteiniphilum propionicum TaxID=2829812 RepID=UPI001EEB4DEA|nr:DEAD/DEAH box helicase family protein [Proteiniphilum propionicum]ULB33181.1 DEAD/DEAH box helicase family protein [Proteiniphilum propionicum]